MSNRPSRSADAPSDAELAKATPADSHEVKARALRALCRLTEPGTLTTPHGFTIVCPVQQRRQREILAAEYERLFGAPSIDGSLELILRDAWIEARQLAGQRYSTTLQQWIYPDGREAG